MSTCCEALFQHADPGNVLRKKRSILTQGIQLLDLRKTVNVAYMPEWSKGEDLRPSVFALVGSNPTVCTKLFR